MDIHQLESYVVLRCVPEYDYSIFSRFLVICQFLPFYISIAIFTVTFTYQYKELYYAFFSLGITLNWLSGIGLQYLIDSRPTLEGCGEPRSTPAWHSQHIFFIYMIFISYMIIQKHKTSLRYIVLLHALPALVCVARSTLNISSFQVRTKTKVLELMIFLGTIHWECLWVHFWTCLANFSLSGFETSYQEDFGESYH